MPVTSQRIEALRAHGLSEYMARAYLALLDLGVAEAREVARLARVPLAKVHATLAALHERSLVEVQPETPRRYAPLPFERYLDGLRADYESRIADIARERERLSGLFRIRGDARLGDRGGVTLLRGRRSVLARARQLVREARGDVLCIATRGEAETLRLARVLQDGVLESALPPRVRVVVPPGCVPHARRALEEFAAVRVRPGAAAGPAERAGVMVADADVALLTHFLPDDGDRQRGEDVGVLLEREALASVMQVLAESAWTASAPDLAVDLGEAPQA